MAEARDPARIRDAATVILLRRDGSGDRILMGQRGAGAVFMPSKFVFPGGAVDPCDHVGEIPAPLEDAAARRLALHAPEGIGPALARAAIRETFEETGLALGLPDPGMAALAPRAPEAWSPFLARGLRPATEALRFIFRAVTPPGRPRRFDARFFLADVSGLGGDLDDFSGASDELGALTWIDLEAARALEMPFITEIVLAELAEILMADDPERRVPFFHHDAERSHFLSL